MKIGEVAAIKQMLKAFSFPLVFFFACPASGSEKDSAFFKQVASGDVHGVRTAISAGQDVNAKDDRGDTPLIALEEKKIREKFDGKTPLEVARLFGNDKAAAYLESAAAKPPRR